MNELQLKPKLVQQKLLICTSADICGRDCPHKLEHEFLDAGCEVTEWCANVHKDTSCIEVTNENK